MTFFRSLFDLAKSQPVMFGLFLLLVVVVLAGPIWLVVGFIFRLVRKVPGVGNKVADVAEGAINKTAAATGSK